MTGMQAQASKVLFFSWLRLHITTTCLNDDDDDAKEDDDNDGDDDDDEKEYDSDCSSPPHAFELVLQNKSSNKLPAQHLDHHSLCIFCNCVLYCVLCLCIFCDCICLQIRELSKQRKPGCSFQGKAWLWDSWPPLFYTALKTSLPPRTIFWCKTPIF